jgi:hypothetical protein
LEGTAATAAAQAATATTGLSDRDVTRIVSELVKQLPQRVDVPQPAAYTPVPHVPKPRGHCFKCGVVGEHYATDCPNPPNPQKVASEEEKRRRRLNRGGPLTTTPSRWSN